MEQGFGCTSAIIVMVQFALIFLKLIHAINWWWIFVLSPTLLLVTALVVIWLICVIE